MNDLATQLGALDIDTAPNCVDIMLELRALRLTLETLERNIMSDFDQMMTELEAQAGMLSELATVTASVHDHVTSQAEGTTVSPVTQQRIDKAMDAMKANRSKLEDLLSKAKGTVEMAAAPVVEEEKPEEQPAVDAASGDGSVAVDPITGVPVNRL